MSVCFEKQLLKVDEVQNLVDFFNVKSPKNVR